MKTLRLVSALIGAFLLSVLIGCSSSNSTHINHPITIVFTANPANSMAESSTQSISATTSAGGVNWTVTCGSADCGSFSSASTGSAAPTKYKAPGTIPSGGKVTVTATSATDASKSVSAQITVTQATTLADGTYVFSLAGQDQSSFFVYYVAGAFTVSGGAITGGEQDLIDYFLGTLSDPITSGIVTVTPDGNVQITLTTADTSIGVSGVETINASMVSGTRALINEFDASATSSGTLDLQTSTTSGQGGYAFFLEGSDVNGIPAAGIGGVVNVDGNGTISGTGSVFDLNDAGATLSGQPIDASTVTTTDAFGRFTMTLNLTTSGVGGIGLVGYIVDGKQIRLVENNNDPVDFNGFFGTVGGNAFAQTGTGAFAAAQLANSSYVFGLNGLDINGPFQMAGVLNTADGVNVTGTLNYNDLSNGATQAPIAVTGAATVDPTGRVTLALSDSTASFVFNTQLYLDGKGHATMLTLDSTDEVAGPAYLQTGGGAFTAASFSGTYAFDLTGYDFVNLFEIDAIGAITSDGTSALTGTVDQNIEFNNTQTANLGVTGTYTARPDGVFSDGMTGLDVTNPANNDTFTYYLIDTTKVLAIETDTNQLGLGLFELQQ